MIWKKRRKGKSKRRWLDNVREDLREKMHDLVARWRMHRTSTQRKDYTHMKGTQNNAKSLDQAFSFASN